MKKINVSCLNDDGREIFDYALKLNLGVEVLTYSMPQNIINEKETHHKMINQFKAFDLKAMHGPYLDMFPSSVDPEILSVVKNRFKSALEAARIIGCKHLILHAGFVPNSMFPTQWLEQSILFWESFMEDIDDIEIHIENVCEEHFGLLKELVEHINKPNFSICLDVGHVHIHSKLSIEEWIEGLNSHIKYVHLHNNNGIDDLHAGIYNGTIDMLSVLKTLEIFSSEATWNLETDRDETIESINYLIKHQFLKEG